MAACVQLNCRLTVMERYLYTVFEKKVTTCLCRRYMWQTLGWFLTANIFSHFRAFLVAAKYFQSFPPLLIIFDDFRVFPILSETFQVFPTVSTRYQSFYFQEFQIFQVF